MTHIDLRTVILLSAVISGIMSAVLYAQARTLPAGITGLRYWSGGALAIAITALLFGLRTAIPDWLSIIVGNGSMFVGTALWVIGSERFYGRRPSVRLLAVAVTAGLLCSYWGLLVMPSFAFRMFCVTFLKSCMFGYQFWLVIRYGERNFPSYLLGGTMLVETCSAVVRCVTSVIPGMIGNDLFAHEAIQTIYITVYEFTTVIMTVGFVMVAMQRLRTELERHSALDPLTGLLNRRALTTVFEREQRVGRVDGGQWTLLLVDLDFFKAVNDRYGHAMGDRVLIDFARRMAQCLPRSAHFVRLGGEEFVVLLPGTSMSQGKAYADVLRKAVSLRDDPALPAYTCSIGVAASPGCGDTLEALMSAADGALYEAKHTGRNRVAVAAGPSGRQALHPSWGKWDAAQNPAPSALDTRAQGMPPSDG